MEDNNEATISLNGSQDFSTRGDIINEAITPTYGEN